MRKYIIMVIFLVAVCCQSATIYKQVDFLMSGYRDSNDVALSGGKVYVYEDELLSTPATLYTDRAGSVAAPNPVILDIYGRAEVYGDGVFTFVIKTSDDVSVETILSAEYKSSISDTTTIEDTLADLEATVDEIGDTYLKLDASNAPLSGNLPMGGNKITNVAVPTLSTDVATKGYADDYVGGVILTAEALANNDILVYNSNGSGSWSKIGISSFLGNSATSLIKFETGSTYHGGTASATPGSGYTTRYFMTGYVFSQLGATGDAIDYFNEFEVKIDPTSGVVYAVAKTVEGFGTTGTQYGTVRWIAISVKE